jgi:GntR family transcriptional regulator
MNQAMDWLIEARRAYVLGGPEAAYYRIAEFFRERISAGLFEVGAQIPTEVEIMKAFGVGRQTVRNAIQVLTADGLLQKQAGRGTFVLRSTLPNRVWTVDSLKSFFEQQYPGVSKVESVDWIKPDLANVQLPKSADWNGDRVLRIELHRRVNRTKISWAFVYLPEWIGDQIHAEITKIRGKGAILRLLEENCGIVIQTVQQTASAVAATHEIARQLGLETGSAVFSLRNAFIDVQGRTVEMSQMFFRSDAYEHHFQISR